MMSSGFTSDVDCSLWRRIGDGAALLLFDTGLRKQEGK